MISSQMATMVTSHMRLFFFFFCKEQDGIREWDDQETGGRLRELHDVDEMQSHELGLAHHNHVEEH